MSAGDVELASLANRRKRLILREFPTDDVDKPGDKCPAVLTLEGRDY